METPPTHLEAALVFQVRSSSPPTARHNASKCTVRARTERFSGGPSTQRVPCNAGEQPRLFSPLKAAFSGFYPLSSPNTPSRARPKFADEPEPVPGRTQEHCGAVEPRPVQGRDMGQNSDPATHPESRLARSERVTQRPPAERTDKIRPNGVTQTRCADGACLRPPVLG